MQDMVTRKVQDEGAYKKYFSIIEERMAWNEKAEVRCIVCHIMLLCNLIQKIGMESVYYIGFLHIMPFHSGGCCKGSSDWPETKGQEEGKGKGGTC